MNKEKVISDKGFEKKQETWSQRIEKNGITERIEVEKLHNKGYLVILNKYGNDSKGKYFDKSIKLYSETNPIDSDESDSPFDQIVNTLTNNK